MDNICTCEPGTRDNGWHEKRCEPCLQAELAAWTACMRHSMSTRRGI